MGSCISTNITPVVKEESTKAAILILCNEGSHDGKVEFVAYKNRVSAAEAAEEHVAQGEEECCICSWDSVQPGQMMVELKKWQYLELGEIYFLLPRRKFRFKVTIQDMSSLLLKTTCAIKSLPFSPLSTYHHNHYEPCTTFQFQGQNEYDFGSRVVHRFQGKIEGTRSSTYKNVMNSHQYLTKQSGWKSKLVSQLGTIMEVA